MAYRPTLPHMQHIACEVIWFPIHVYVAGNPTEVCNLDDFLILQTWHCFNEVKIHLQQNDSSMYICSSLMEVYKQTHKI